ncbi:MAG: putative two-component membrane permease complex subunit SMU_746c [Anaerolineae bacterium]|nr:putative two-component membrane permease complex subunit SMU_746c [Anaerolineae bacterium]
MPTSFKALALMGMGLFLYFRFFSGSLLFYINERFIWLTFLAALGLVLVGASYRYRPHHAHPADHQHGQLSWAGLLLVFSPVILGLIVPPKPLGAAAMSNRDVSLKSLTSAGAPTNSTVLSKPRGEKNILDWVVEFQSAKDPAAFAGQEAKVTGFVYRDERFAPNEFMVSRFVVSCCAADAAPIGLVVRAENGSDFASDAWVEVTGQFTPGQFAGESLPLLAAASVSPTDVPEQPYLYPY